MLTMQPPVDVRWGIVAARGEEHRIDVDRHHTTPLFGREFRDVPERADAGVVDEDVEPTEAVNGGLYERVDVRLVGDIGAPADAVDTPGVQFTGDPFESFLVRIAEHETRALSPQPMGGRLADSRGRTGDDRDPAGESRCHCRTSRIRWPTPSAVSP